MPTVYKRCGKSLNVNEISEGRHAAVRLVYNEVRLSIPHCFIGASIPANTGQYRC
jgi:hypothetical protein